MQTISATELARNTREILDKIAGNGEIMEIERNHTVVARIVPVESSNLMTASQAFAGLSFATLTPKQATNWLRDSKGKFDETVRDPWA